MHIFFPSMLYLILLKTLWPCWIVEWLFLNPNWCVGSRPSICIVSSSLWSRNRSNTLDIMGKRLIGLYELSSVGGFPGLAIIIICAYFHWTGKQQRRRILLKMDVSNTIAFRGRFLSTVPCIRSYPGACEG